MRQWLLHYIRQLFIYAMGSTQPASAEGIDTPDEPDVEKNCTICGEVWDEGEIFCYHCGYEMKDDNIPLNPPPVRTGAVSDPEGIIPVEKREAVAERFGKIAEQKGIDIAVIIVPEKLRKAAHPCSEAGTEKPDGYSIEGLMYGLYNTWMVGKDRDFKGILLGIDPDGADRVLVQGRNGPGISGKEFRGWYGEYSPGQAGVDRVSGLVAEMEYVAGKIEKLKEG